MNAPFPYFGGKSKIAPLIWQRLGRVDQYIEPFAGSMAVLLAAPRRASLEVVGDASGFIANFWRSVIHDHTAVARWADYPVSHVDLGARHGWLMARREALAEGLADPEWPGDAKVAGWWLWGQCCWIGRGWCEWSRNAGMGVQAIGQVPHVSDAGRGVQAIGQVPHVSGAGMGVQMWTSGGRTALARLGRLAARLERVRVIHGDWTRTLNHHYGKHMGHVGVFLDPPYDGFGSLYSDQAVAADVGTWAREHGHLRVCLAGHAGDYEMPGWDAVAWSRPRNTYSGSATKDDEMLWFSPACPGGQAVLL